MLAGSFRLDYFLEIFFPEPFRNFYLGMIRHQYRFDADRQIVKIRKVFELTAKFVDRRFDNFSDRTMSHSFNRAGRDPLAVPRLLGDANPENYFPLVSDLPDGRRVFPDAPHAAFLSEHYPRRRLPDETKNMHSASSKMCRTLV